ncbi:hypothetical protein N8586_06090 [Verrucomicrobiales bacterium]|nr:hypothetical protein [Verrucomicrobiales bacterium]
MAHSNPAKEGSELSLSVGRAFDGLVTISRRAVFFMVEPSERLMARVGF